MSQVQLPDRAQMDQRRANWMAGWLLTVAGMVLVMVALGGLTRLTHSGLSMVEWKVFTGWIPPLNEQDWAILFEKYRQFPEFMKVNADMTVEGFKGIFWLEFIHRVWGRLIGLVFFIPFATFLVMRWVRVSEGLFWKFLGLLVLGASQGVMGWFMVMSGLVDRPDVSQYRLTAHFGLAVVIIGALIWVAMSLLKPKPYDEHHQDSASLNRWAFWLMVLIFVTAMSGGFVAGLDAGFAYNTFPLMDGEIIPGGLFDYSPVWLAPFEDITTVQFDHRTLAELTIVLILVFWMKSVDKHLAPRTRRAIQIFGLMALLQVSLGISTLLLVVPIALASLHQLGAVVLFSLSLWVVHELRMPQNIHGTMHSS
ncbi:MAG: COX15/CtaA family protein [Magnetovibrio sp.]|nr:COX15/CtaA family protein [Magnetovibrio sp.]